MKNPFSGRNMDELFAFPDLFPAIEAGQLSLTSNEKQEVQKQLDLIKISTLLDLEDYQTLHPFSYPEFQNFLYPFIQLMETFKHEDWEIYSTLKLMTALIDLYPTFDQEFYEKHMSKLLVRADQAGFIQFFAEIEYGTSPIEKIVFINLKYSK